MAKHKKTRDPLPNEFPSWREAAEFWDTHDTGDYPEAWKPIDETIELIEEQPLHITLSPPLARELQMRAEQMKIPAEKLANQLLEATIRKESKAAHRIAERPSTYRKVKAKRS